MNFGKFFLTAAAVAIAPAAAQAQDVGATIMGNDGNAVGTVISNDGTTVMVDTGEHEVPLGTDAFAQDDSGYSLNISRTQLNQMMDEQLAAQEAAQAEQQAAAEAEAAAALEAALVVGAPVVTADAQSLGMVDEIAGTNVIIKGEDETLVTLPVDLLAVDADGSLMALANLADIRAALEAQAGG